MKTNDSASSSAHKALLYPAPSHTGGCSARRCSSHRAATRPASADVLESCVLPHAANSTKMPLTIHGGAIAPFRRELRSCRLGSYLVSVY